jgi:hypothetical protein
MKSTLSKIYINLICLITPRCREMARLISAEQEKSPPFLVRLRMRWHYSICVWCERYRDQVGLLGKLSRMFADESCKHRKNQLTDEAKTRLKEALRHKGND